MTGMTKESAKASDKPKPMPEPEAGYKGAYIYLSVVALLSALPLWDYSTGLMRLTGLFLVAGLLLAIFYRDMLRYKPNFVRKGRMLLLLSLMIVGTLVVCRASEHILLALAKGSYIQSHEAIVYGFPVAAGAMLVMLLFDFHTAIVFSFIISLLAGLWRADASYTIYAFVGSLAASFSMLSCKRRTAILRGGMIVFAANLITLLTILFYKDQVFTEAALVAALFAAISSVVVVAVVSLLLPLLENVFKVTTDISLLELLDLDHPLMKSLMINAPGTYHHSIIVGNLVESCAETVGVNPLMARVGAYYHDIGKVKMPEYFIENVASGVSKHEKLTPHMSAMVLTSHVKEGVDLAVQHKLPEDVVDIIQQHHGNALITYFYDKAKKEANGEGPNEDTYRYPGPRPQSRTSALIMMADAVEASSRVLTDPTSARISALVDKIINHIFLTGQLEECRLTLKDIHEIKKRFTYILTGIMHRRIDYPGFDFNKAGGKRDEGNGKQHAEEDSAGRQADRAGLAKGARVS